MRPRSSTRQPELARASALRADAGRPDDRARQDARPVGEDRRVRLDRLERRRRRGSRRRAARAARRRSRRGGAGSPARIFGAASTSTQRCGSRAERGVVAQRVADEVGELGERLDARVAGADEDEASARRRRCVSFGAATAASSRRSTWLRSVIASGRSLKPSACSARPGIGERARDGAERDHEVLVADPEEPARPPRRWTRCASGSSPTARPSSSSACGPSPAAGRRRGAARACPRPPRAAAACRA